MKRLLMISLIVLCFIPVHTYAENETENTIFNESNIENIADSSEAIRNLMPNFSFYDITDKIKTGKIDISPKNLLGKFLRKFFDEISDNIYIMLTVIVLAIIWGIVINIQSSYGSKAVSDTAFFAFFAVFLGLVIKGMDECVNLAHSVISDQVVFMKAAVPVYTAIVISIGNPSAAGMEPVFLYFIQLMGSFLEKLILPLIFWISVLNMVNCLTDKFSIKKLIEFIKQVIKWGIGIIMTLFIGILGMSGITASMADGLGIKTLKFAVGNFVPVVGGLLSDSVTTVLASAAVLKNALGTAGVITVIMMCIGPLIEMLALILIYKLSTGIIEPISDKRITAMVSEAGSTITFIFLILLTVTIMFIIGITIVINVGNKFSGI